MAGKTGLRMGCCGPFVRSLGAAGASGGGRDDPPASAASSSIQGTLTSPLGSLTHVRCATARRAAAARRAVAVPDRTVVIGCDQAGLVQPGRKGRWRSRAIFAAAWHRCRSSALRCLPRPGSGSPVLEEAARELEAAAHDARVAFDCVALGELDRAHTSALTARVAADAAVTALQAALLAASTAAGS